MGDAVKYYVFSTQSDAATAVGKIDTRAKELAQAAGRLDAGGLIGRNAASGALDVGAARTTTWAIPTQNSLGQWVVLVPTSTTVTSGGMTIAQYVTQDLAGAATADDLPSWWPPAIPPR